MEDDPILIEVDSRLIVNLVALASIAIQMAIGSSTAPFPASDAIPYLNAHNAAPGASMEASA